MRMTIWLRIFWWLLRQNQHQRPVEEHSSIKPHYCKPRTRRVRRNTPLTCERSLSLPLTEFDTTNRSVKRRPSLVSAGFCSHVPRLVIVELALELSSVMTPICQEDRDTRTHPHTQHVLHTHILLGFVITYRHCNRPSATSADILKHRMHFLQNYLIISITWCTRLTL